MKQISIIGATFIGNRGAEAMLTTTIGRIREKYPDARFNVYSYYPKDDRRLVEDSNVFIYSATPSYLMIFFPLCLLLGFFKLLRINFLQHAFPKSVVALVNSDVLIDIAGVSFIDGREKFLPYNVLTVLPAFLLRVPVVKFSQAMGPFHNAINLFCAKFILNRCRKIFARGKQTYDNLIHLGIKPQKLEQASDLAFLHRSGDSLSIENAEYCESLLIEIHRLRKSGERIIGLCPSSVIASQAIRVEWDYIGFLCSIISRLVSQGYKIVLFPNATRESEPNKLRNNDLPVIQAIMERLALTEDIVDSIIQVHNNLNNDSIRRLIACCDINVVSRFHAMVASLSLGVPVFVVGWSHKYLEVMEQFGQSEWVYDYKQTEINELLTKIVLLFKDKDEQSMNINANLIRVQNEAIKQLKYLFDFLGE